MALDTKLCSSSPDTLFGFPIWLGTISDRIFRSRAWTCTSCLEKNKQNTPGQRVCSQGATLSCSLFCADFLQLSGRCFFPSSSCVTSATVKPLLSLGWGCFFFPRLIIDALFPCDVVFCSSLMFLSFLRADEGVNWVSLCHAGCGTGGLDAAINPETWKELIY